MAILPIAFFGDRRRTLIRSVSSTVFYTAALRLMRVSAAPQRTKDTKKPRLERGLRTLTNRIEQSIGGGTQIRTGDKGFAVLGLTTWLCRLFSKKKQR